MLRLKLIHGDDRFIVAPTPERIGCKVAGRWAAYDLLSPGPTEIKNGDMPDEIVFDGILISEANKNCGIVSEEDWVPPMSGLTLLEDWHRAGAEVTLSIGDDAYIGGSSPQHPFDGKPFYIGQFGWDHAGGNGDIFYSISLREVRKVGVQTKKPISVPRSMIPPVDGKILITEISRVNPVDLSKQYTDQYSLVDPFVSLMSVEQKTFLATNGYLKAGTYNFPDAWRTAQKGTVK